VITVDADGLSCPEPVILLKDALAVHDEVELLVDNKTSAAVCKRYAESKNYFAEVVNRNGGGYALTVRKTGGV